MHDGKLRLQSTGKARIVVEHLPQPAHADAWTTTTSRGPTTTRTCSTRRRATTSRRRGRSRWSRASRSTSRPGPNWDDDLGGSPIYAANDPNLDGLTAEQRQQLFAIERLVFFYLPRICNHCLNPACVAACPSGALYKRGEDGIVLVDQKRCRGWRACVPACPYKKTLLQLVDRQVGEVHPLLPAHRDRPGAGLLPLLRRAHPLPRRAALRRVADRGGRVERPDERLVEAQRSLILDPHDPAVIDGAPHGGIAGRDVIEAAQTSPVYNSSRSGSSRCRRTSSSARCRCCSTCRRSRR